jgi:hypothetical protein
MIEAIIFLLGTACGMQGIYLDLFDAHVFCYVEGDWQIAREKLGNLHPFEDEYLVVYVTQDRQMPAEAPEGAWGQAWYLEGYAYSVNSHPVISHELEHLRCGCYFTPDGRHDVEKNVYPQLWKEEHGM